MRISDAAAQPCRRRGQDPAHPLATAGGKDAKLRLIHAMIDGVGLDLADTLAR